MIVNMVPIVIIVACVFAPAAWTAEKTVPAADGAAAESLYAYSDSDLPQVFFFPKETARWDGAKITLKEWYMLTDLQKQKFFSEYIGELERQYHQSIHVTGLDYLEALNVFSYYSNGTAMNEPSTKFIDRLLDGQGKLPVAGAAGETLRNQDHN